MKSGAAGFLGMIASWSQRKVGSNAIANKKPLAKQPYLTLLAMRSSNLSCKFHVCTTIALNHSQKPTNELGQLCPPNLMENPGVVDARYAAAKSVDRMPDSSAAHATCAKAIVFNLKNIVSHLLGRDTSLRWMFSSGVPLKAPATRRGENLAITITAVSTDVVPLTHDTAIVVDVGGFLSCGQVFIKFISVNFPTYGRQEPSERTATYIMATVASRLQRAL